MPCEVSLVPERCHVGGLWFSPLRIHAALTLPCWSLSPGACRQQNEGLHPWVRTPRLQTSCMEVLLFVMQQDLLHARTSDGWCPLTLPPRGRLWVSTLGCWICWDGDFPSPGPWSCAWGPPCISNVQYYSGDILHTPAASDTLKWQCRRRPSRFTHLEMVSMKAWLLKINISSIASSKNHVPWVTVLLELRWSLAFKKMLSSSL